MKVKILYATKYLDPDRLPLHKARRYEAGDVVEFPADYAESMMAMGRVKPFSEPDMTGGAEVEVDATDAARKLAGAEGVDLGQVEATGQDGRVLLSDVKGFLEG